METNNELDFCDGLIQFGTPSPKFSYDFPRPALTVDIIITNGTKKALSLLLVKRSSKAKKFPGFWALPGGYMNIGETLEEAAIRELREETSIKIEKDKGSGRGLKFECMMDDPEREDGDRIISAVFSKLVYSDFYQAGDDADDAKWESIFNIPDELAFDHRKIIRKVTGY